MANTPSLPKVQPAVAKSRSVAIAIAAVGLMMASTVPAAANYPPAVPPNEGEESVTAMADLAPAACATAGPAGSVLSGVNVFNTCNTAVAQAVTNEARAAIRYGFSKLGTPYSQDPTLRTTSHFDCSSFIGRAYNAGGGKIRRYNDTLVDFFPYFGWTGAYVEQSAYASGYRIGYAGTNLQRLGSKAELRPGDIIIQFNGSNPANSAGNAGHAQIWLGNGLALHSGRGPNGVSQVSVVNQSRGSFTNEWYFRYNSLNPAAANRPAPPAPIAPAPLAPGTVKTIATGRANAAVYGTVVAIDPNDNGFITAYPCAEGRPLVATTNFMAGRTTSAFVAAKADASGNLCLFNSARTHMVFDQVMADPIMAMHNGVRQADSRVTSPVAQNTVRRIDTGSPGKTIVGSLTVTVPQRDGWAVAYACDTPVPMAATVNYTAGATTSNVTAVRADANGQICVYTSALAHVIWDKFADTITLPNPNPLRTLDTRLRSGGGAKLAAGATRIVNTGSPGRTVLATVTAVQPDAAGFMTVYPCDVNRPWASSMNYHAGQIVSNTVAVRADANGEVCIFTSATSHVLWDQVSASAHYQAQTPARKLDTRT